MIMLCCFGIRKCSEGHFAVAKLMGNETRSNVPF